MAENPDLFVRVSNDSGHHSTTAVAAERAGSKWRVLKQSPRDRFGRLLASKPRTDIEDTPPARKRSPKLRDDTAAATPTEPGTVSGESD